VDESDNQARKHDQRDSFKDTGAVERQQQSCAHGFPPLRRRKTTETVAFWPVCDILADSRSSRNWSRCSFERFEQTVPRRLPAFDALRLQLYISLARTLKNTGELPPIGGFL